MIVYSITSKPTFDRVEKFKRQIARVKDLEYSLPSSPLYTSDKVYGSAAYPGSGGTSAGGSLLLQDPSASTSLPIVIVGNKADKIHEREVTTEEGRALAKRLGCEFGASG